MAKSKRSRIRRESQVTNKLRNGHGLIDSQNPDQYKPFLLIHDFSSRGRSTRTRSGKRLYHLMSDLETTCLRELQWNPNVIAIYEQVYLDREDTVAIAQAIGVRYPTLSADGLPYPMTTDLVAEIVENGVIRQHAFAVKPMSAVDYTGYDRNAERKSRAQRAIENTIDKLEIERRYWAQKGAKWSLVTDAVLSKVRRTNIEIFQNTDEPERRLQPDYWEGVTKLSLQAIKHYPNRKLGSLARSLEERFQVPRADVVFALRYMCKQRYLDFNLDVPFGSNCHGRDFRPANRKAPHASKAEA